MRLINAHLLQISVAGQVDNDLSVTGNELLRQKTSITKWEFAFVPRLPELNLRQSAAPGLPGKGITQKQESRTVWMRTTTVHLEPRSLCPTHTGD